ncbi:alpha/beta hydrolase [Demequina oxidasica]|uniref:alpha/beta hydrolase n=1 Tax=Demequina oxidasica TaxID=676199 RepID=UPI000782D783|nr:alpha/beta hydrolase [Demequina oxidasica]
MTHVSVPELVDSVPPLHGNSAAVNECAAELLRASSALDDLDTACAANNILDGWVGAGATAYGDRVKASAKDADAASLAIRRAAKAMWDYGDSMERLESTRETLVDWHTSLNSSIRSLAAEVRIATDDDASALQGWAQDLRLSRRNYVSSVNEFEASIDANNSTLRAALAAVDTVAEARKIAAKGDGADAAMKLPGAPGGGSSPQQVNDWWNSLTEDQQFAVIAAYPEVIGAADGLSAEVRDQANRLMLENDVAQLDLAEGRGKLTPEQRVHGDNIRAAQRALDESEGRSGDDATTIDPITGEPIPVSLMLYQPAAFGNDGAVAIAIGDPDTADNVSVSVPGIMTDGSSIPDYAADARNLYESARLSDPYSTSATIAWIGYNNPSDLDLGHTVTESAAIDGGERLSKYVSGIQSVRSSNPPLMTVIGHSYGSTTSAHAASDAGLDVDNLVLIGSPGAGGGVDQASDLHVPQVWAGNSSRDVVAALADNGWVGGHTLGGAGLGNDVAEDDFGATRFQAEDESRASWYRNIDDHVKYYDRGTEAIFNMGQIMVGDYDEVTQAEYVHDPWWGPPQDPEASRTPTPTLSTDDEIRIRRE